MKMLRTTLACLVAIAVPAFAQGAGPRAPRGPQSNRLERTLTEILKRLDRLEKRMDAKASTPAKPAVIRGRIVGLPPKSYLIGEANAPLPQTRKQGDVLVLSNPMKRIVVAKKIDRQFKQRPMETWDVRSFEREGRELHRKHDRRREHRPDHPRQRPHEQRPDDRRHRRSGGPRGHKMRGDTPLSNLPGVMQAARKGDPRARHMLTRLRNAINEILGDGTAKKPAALSFGFTAVPKAEAASRFRLRGADGHVVDLRKRTADVEALRKHAEAQRFRVARLNKSNAVRAMKMREAEEMMKKKAMVNTKRHAAKSAVKLTALRAEMLRLQLELERLKLELAQAK